MGQCEHSKLVTMEYKLGKKDPISRCLQCGTPIEYGGRPDRKFCCPACKNKYNNYRRSRRNDLARRSVSNILAKNYEVLSRLIGMGVKSIDKVSLSYMGFEQGYTTSYNRVGRKNVYTCYNIRYELTPTRLRQLCYMD